MPIIEVISREYQGETVEISFHETLERLFILPDHFVGRTLSDLPKRKVKRATVLFLKEESTVSEKQLWSLLRKKGTGIKFRRQHPLGGFILDFYAPQIRLAVELDGGIHEKYDQKEYDHFRQELIEIHDIKVLRIKNNAIRGSNILPQLLMQTITERLKYYWYDLIWTPAGEIRKNDLVFSGGRKDKHTIRSIRKFAVQERVFDLRVIEDNSYVTNSCTLASSHTPVSKHGEGDIFLDSPAPYLGKGPGEGEYQSIVINNFFKI